MVVFVPDVGIPPGMDQFQDVIGSVGEEVDALVKVDAEFRQRLVLLNPATGGGLTVAGNTTVVGHPGVELEVTVRVTE